MGTLRRNDTCACSLRDFVHGVCELRELRVVNTRRIGLLPQSAVVDWKIELDPGFRVDVDDSCLDRFLHRRPAGTDILGQKAVWHLVQVGSPVSPMLINSEGIALNRHTLCPLPWMEFVDG